MKYLCGLIFVFCSVGLAQQGESRQSQENICNQNKEVRFKAVKKAEAENFRVRRIEIAGNENTQHRVFAKRMAFWEGDIFTQKSLSKTIKNFSKIREIKPVTIENVGLRLYPESKDVDLVFCVEEKRKQNL